MTDNIPIGDFESHEKSSRAEDIHGRVLHLRNLPKDATYSEVVAVCVPFGKLAKILFMKLKKQALVEFTSYEEAHNMILYGSKSYIVLKKHKIYVQSSKHESLNTKDNELDELRNAQKDFKISNPTKVLHLIVNDMVHPVNMETVYTLFSFCALVRKIVIFTKDEKFHALIEVEDVESAIITKLVLNGNFMYNESNRMTVLFSGNNTLSINNNDLERSRDFTIYPFQEKKNFKSLMDKPKKNDSNYEIQDSKRFMNLPPSSNLNTNNGYNNSDRNEFIPHDLSSLPYEGNSAGRTDHFKSRVNHNDSVLAPDSHTSTSSVYVNEQYGSLPFSNRFSGSVLSHTSDERQNIVSGVSVRQPTFGDIYQGNYTTHQNSPDDYKKPLDSFPGRYNDEFSSYYPTEYNMEAYYRQREENIRQREEAIRLRELNFDKRHEQRIRRKSEEDIRSIRESSSTPVIIVSGLPNCLSCKDIAVFYCCFGDVKKVKISYKRRDTAFVEFTRREFATSAIKHTDGLNLKNAQLRVNQSHHRSLSEVRSSDTHDLYIDFDYPENHRFKKPGSKNIWNIFSPSNKLHISNIPGDVTNSQLIDLFRSANFNVDDFYKFNNDVSMAYITLSDTTEAILALVKFHNYGWENNKKKLKVSFAKIK